MTCVRLRVRSQARPNQARGGARGYDNVKKKYVHVWLDSLSSGISTSEGTADATGKVITLTGKCIDPVTGGEQSHRVVLTVVDDKKHVLEFFGPGRDGAASERNMMQIDYIKK